MVLQFSAHMSHVQKVYIKISCLKVAVKLYAIYLRVLCNMPVLKLRLLIKHVV